MNETFDSVPSAVTSQAIAASFAKEELARREAMNLNWQFFYGDQSEYVNTLSSEAMAVVVNLTRPIVKKRSSLLYQNKLSREVTGPSASIDALERIWEDNSMDSFMLKIDRLAELTGSALVFPRPDPTLPGGVRYIPYNGIMVSILGKEDNPYEMEAVSIIRIVDRIVVDNSAHRSVPLTQKVLVQQIWTDTAVVTYEAGKLTTSEPNELGFVPFANFKGEEVDGQAIGYSPASSIRQLNLTYNQMLSDLAYTIKMQAASPLVLEGYQSGEQIVLHPGRAISLPVGAKAHTIDFNPKIQDTLLVLEHIEEKIYETSSVPKVSVVGGEGVSGRELLVRWFPLVEVFREKSTRFQAYELELANMTLASIGLEPIDELLIDYPDEDNFPLSADDDNLDRDIRLGITSPVDQIMKENPEMSPNEAAAHFVRNKGLQVDTISPVE